MDILQHYLEKSEYKCIGIHGDKKQFQRQRAIRLFSSGNVPILIATDVASRGIDFPNVSFVINFDMPNNIDDYIHRIGRSGRCGNKGKAISFINEKCVAMSKDLLSLLKKHHQNVPEWFVDFCKNNPRNCNNFLI